MSCWHWIRILAPCGTYQLEYKSVFHMYLRILYVSKKNTFSEKHIQGHHILRKTCFKKYIFFSREIFIFNIPNSSQDYSTCASLWFDEFLKKDSSENAKNKYINTWFCLDWMDCLTCFNIHNSAQDCSTLAWGFANIGCPMNFQAVFRGWKRSEFQGIVVGQYLP